MWGYQYNQLWLTNLEKEHIVFKVTACSDAFILLARYPKNPRMHAYEIWLDADNYGLTKLLKDGVEVKQSSSSLGTLDCGRETYFWISWQNGIIEVGSGYVPYLSGFLLYNEPDGGYPITALSFASGDSIESTWDFGQVTGQKKCYYPLI